MVSKPSPPRYQRPECLEELYRQGGLTIPIAAKKVGPLPTVILAILGIWNKIVSG